MGTKGYVIFLLYPFFLNLEVPETVSQQFEMHNEVCGSVTLVILFPSATSLIVARGAMSADIPPSYLFEIPDRERN